MSIFVFYSFEYHTHLGPCRILIGRLPRTGARAISAALYSAAVTGEEYVALELLDRLMEFRARGEHLRKTFHRVRRSGLLDDIPGLVYVEGDEKQPAARLVNTGIQRMVQDLDELPHPLVSLAL